jgi:hypothetical protein
MVMVMMVVIVVVVVIVVFAVDTFVLISDGDSVPNWDKRSCWQDLVRGWMGIGNEEIFSNIFELYTFTTHQMIELQNSYD